VRDVTDFSSQKYDQARHNTAAFDSGEPSLDEWLHRHAATSVARGTAAVFVWTRADTVVAYYTLSAYKIVSDDLPRKLARGGPREIPAVMLGRLALDRSLRGQDLGPVLLGDALARVVDATTTVAARYIVVDAINDKVMAFYARFGFKPTPVERRMVLRISEIATADQP
jgi:predicted GNAT family N-acyltransferase